jgi:hypothetical protein
MKPPELLRFKAGDEVSIQGARKITIYEKNGEHRAVLDIMGSYVLTLRQPPKERKSRQEAAMVKSDHDVGDGNY